MNDVTCPACFSHCRPTHRGGYRCTRCSWEGVPDGTEDALIAERDEFCQTLRDAATASIRSPGCVVCGKPIAMVSIYRHHDFADHRLPPPPSRGGFTAFGRCVDHAADEAATGAALRSAWSGCDPIRVLPILWDQPAPAIAAPPCP